MKWAAWWLAVEYEPDEDKDGLRAGHRYCEIRMSDTPVSDSTLDSILLAVQAIAAERKQAK